ncbi:MAG: YezD family protein [Treponema sp.]|jgi:hypothetical protein|nr:YezD family protein [Treponema sp.]
MNEQNTKMMVARLMTNVAGLRYGSASVTVKLHDGRVVQVSYATQEHTREQAEQKENDE